MSNKNVIVFVCEHGAAKSIVAAAYFNQFAREQNLQLHAIARATNPDLQLSPVTSEGIIRDGLTLPETVPQKLTAADIESARQIISFCELPAEYSDLTISESWQDISPVSENYERARDQIIARLRQLMGQ